MKFLYNLIILVTRFLYWIASFFNHKAAQFAQGHANIFYHLQQALAENTAPIIWVHCASLGEFEQGRPVIEKLKSEFPAYKILLTFFSPSGYEVRKNYDKADFVFYLPWDSANHASRFISLTKPSLAIFIKYEFWFHYSTELKRRKIPLLSVSSIFRSNQLFFKPYGNFYRKILRNFDFFFVQNHESLQLLSSIHVTNSAIAGDTRFDRVYEMVQKSESVSIAEKFKASEKVMVVGSCWPEDLEVLIPFINDHYNTLKFIIAPHEISEATIQRIEKAVHARSVRFSNATDDSLPGCQILLIDNIGMLGRLYKYGEYAFIGGAFGKGLHNILEAACYGIPIFFGNKKFSKFQEAVDLINRGGAFEVADYYDLKEKYEAINIPQTFLLACDVTRTYVQENLGATEKVMNYCRTILRT